MEKNFTLFSNVPFSSDGQDLNIKRSAQKNSRAADLDDQCPGEPVIANILNFSKALEVLAANRPEEKSGIEVVLN